MKRVIFTLIIMSLFAGMIMFAAPGKAQAQTYQRRVIRNGRVHWVRTAKPSFIAGIETEPIWLSEQGLVPWWAALSAAGRER